MSVTIASPIATRLGDFALGRGIWLLLLAQFLSTLPASATGIFLPEMAADLGTDVALIGGLRGLGGAAALICGVLAAPLIDRIARASVVASALLVLAVGAFLAAYGSMVTLAIFFALAGAAVALAQPALQSAAADGHDALTGARAASIVSAFGALSPMLAGPLLAVPALYWGWRGDFVAMAISCVLIAALTGGWLSRRPPVGLVRPAYLVAFRVVGSAPGALPLLLGSTLRGILQIAWLTYLAAFLVQRFGASLAEVAATWTLGGTAFFITNLWVGRSLGAAESSGWRTPERMLPASLVVLSVLTPLGLLVPILPIAMLVAGLTAGAHGAIVAATISLLVGRYTGIRGAVLGLNAAGANVGLFAGAAIGGSALAWAGYGGLTAMLAILAVATSAAFVWALRWGAPAERSVVLQ
jgi:predicted MFS family arabinose efflux permease